MSVLPNGEYAIINKATELIVGRNVFEDKSGLPKGIFTLDPSVGTEDGRRVSACLSLHPLTLL